MSDSPASSASGSSAPSGIRASDADRERVARILRAATGEGLLTLEEADERLAAAYAARYVHELGPLTADLPGQGRPLIDEPVPPRDGERHWFGERGDRPGHGARVTWHAVTVALIAAILVSAWIGSGAHFFWPLWPIAFLAFGAFRHARWSGHHPGWSGRRGC
jgi:Domain of unknown function (DUF1707)